MKHHRKLKPWEKLAADGKPELDLAALEEGGLRALYLSVRSVEGLGTFYMGNYRDHRQSAEVRGRTMLLDDAKRCGWLIDKVLFELPNYQTAPVEDLRRFVDDLFRGAIVRRESCLKALTSRHPASCRPRRERGEGGEKGVAACA